MDRNAPMTIPPKPLHDVACSQGQNRCSDPLDVANDFVGEKENRKQLFGKFSASDIPNKFSISSKSTQTENYRQEQEVL